MSQFELMKTRLANGVWEGILARLEAGEQNPDIRVLHRDQEVPGVEVTLDPASGAWAVRVPVPTYAIADGVHTFAIFDGSEKLTHFTLMAGDVLADDIRAEMELLRAELDMLKRAFRRHCVETA
ncbi:hypothetical protein [Aestuariivita boseongensis]|uniref:hypothetical protein n=1 Tax=Aestuariivita boseongensis TaxID=1470562 RepID=UPI000681313D|nr:hypothetical protein [Aestuariivita boseongensis]